ncbi:MAG: 6-phosphofructokinase [Bacteroidales bacterium]|nr:MAG: 6-phosphofructokinase [Bacteroidales bacterium]
MEKQIGILTAGGDCPGLNAAIRGIGKTAVSHGMQVIGFKDGFRGLMENRYVRLDNGHLSGILAQGGTLLGTSRDKPHKMLLGGNTVDMTNVIAENYHSHHLDVLVCLGGGGTAKNAYKLHQKGLNVITLPKTIDNDIFGTDVSFGFDTALHIAVEAIDRLHSTAHSHHRIIVVEIMGHRAGWLALGAGVAGGADAILIPEIPYDINVVAESILSRSRRGKRFSIVAIAEGAVSKEFAEKRNTLENELDKEKEKAKRNRLKRELKDLEVQHAGNTLKLSQELEKLTGLESRLTILGHLQRGGTPSAADRLLATRLGTACVDSIREGIFGVMIAARGDHSKPVPLDKVVNKLKLVPSDHPWVLSARDLGTSFGD